MRNLYPPRFQRTQKITMLLQSLKQKYNFHRLLLSLKSVRTFAWENLSVSKSIVSVLPSHTQNRKNRKSAVHNILKINKKKSKTVITHLHEHVVIYFSRRDKDISNFITNLIISNYFTLFFRSPNFRRAE